MPTLLSLGNVLGEAMRVPDQASVPHEMDTMTLFEIHDYYVRLRQPKRDAERKREQRRRSLAGTR